MKLEDFDDDKTPVDEPGVKDEIGGGTNRNSVRSDVRELNNAFVQLLRQNLEARDLFRDEAKADRLVIKDTLETILRRMFVRDAVLFAIAICALVGTALIWNRQDVLEQRVTAVERAP